MSKKLSSLAEAQFLQGNIPASEPVPGTRLRKLIEPYFWAVGRVMPKGYTSNGANVPIFARGLTYPPNDSRIARAFWVHDRAYQTHEIPRKLADQLFRDIAILDGANKFKARLMYAALRAFGRLAWNKGGPRKPPAMRGALVAS